MSTKVKKNQTATLNKYSYKYVDIAQIHDYLESINAKYIQQIKRIENDDYIMTKRCFNDNWEDEWLQGSKVVDATLIGNDNPAQKQGSAITYARRYSLLMAFGLATEDDDAVSLSVETKVESPTDFANSYKFKSGKHAGETLAEVIEKDDKFIDWILENSKNKQLIECINALNGNKKSESEELINNRMDLWVELQNLANKNDCPIENILAFYGVKDSRTLTVEQLKDAINRIESIRGK